MHKILTGRTQNHLQKDQTTTRLFHKEVLNAFLELKEKALKENIDLYITSSFRSFEDQLSIWNKKAIGEKQLFNDKGEELRYSDLSPSEVMFSILRWSALPGASRHHWGTDIDLVDKNTWPEGYHVELIPQEFNEGGYFHKFTKWFDNLLLTGENLGFYRPYQRDQQGVAPEMWHLSYAPVADILEGQYSIDFFINHVNSLHPQEFELLDIVKENTEEIYHNYVMNICK